MVAVGIQGVSLTPFYYHGLYVPDGSATHPAVITDTALVFALQSLFHGSDWRSPRPTPDYQADLAAIPWRASLLMGEGNFITAPVRHTVDMSREGGFTERIQHNMGSGNYKNTFFVHEVAPGARYEGVLVGPDPFQALETDEIIVRVGVGRQGMLALSKVQRVDAVRLNTATGKLFGSRCSAQYRIMDTIRPSWLLPVEEAVEELERWR